jgi:hypothetical protein
VNAETIRPAAVEAFPSAFEVAILHLPAGAVARVHHPFGVREYCPLLVECEVYAVVPGFKDVIGWGAVPCWHPSLRSVRNGRHRLDQSAWHHAADLLKNAGVVYVGYEERDYYGRPRWTAVSAWLEPQAARLAEQAGASS